MYSCVCMLTCKCDCYVMLSSCADAFHSIVFHCIPLCFIVFHCVFRCISLKYVAFVFLSIGEGLERKHGRQPSRLDRRQDLHSRVQLFGRVQSTTDARSDCVHPPCTKPVFNLWLVFISRRVRIVECFFFFSFFGGISIHLKTTRPCF